jgi:hypothetical protein
VIVSAYNGACLFALSASTLILTSCSDRSLHGSTSIAVGASACLNYMRGMEDSGDVDEALTKLGWVRVQHKGAGFNRSFVKEGVTVSFDILSTDPFGKPRLKKQVSCVAVLTTDSEKNAQSMVKSANEIVGLREMSPFRYATEGDNPDARAVISYGTPIDGKILVLVEMDGDPPA